LTPSPKFTDQAHRSRLFRSNQFPIERAPEEGEPRQINSAKRGTIKSQVD